MATTTADCLVQTGLRELLRRRDYLITKDAYATHSMSWSSGSSGPSPFVEEPYLTEAERESIGPLSEWVLNMVRTADGSVGLPKEGKDVDAILLHRPLTCCT